MLSCILPGAIEAFPADAPELYPVVLNLESGGRRVRDLQLGQLLVVKINHPVTVQANQVVVVFGGGVVACHPARVAGLGDHTEIDQKIQRSVDRGPGDAGAIVTHGLEHLVGRRVVEALENRLENDSPLQGAGDSTLPAECFQFPEPCWDVLVS